MICGKQELVVQAEAKYHENSGVELQAPGPALGSKPIRLGSNSGGECCWIFYLELTGAVARIRKTGVGETAISAPDSFPTTSHSRLIS